MRKKPIEIEIRTGSLEEFISFFSSLDDFYETPTLSEMEDRIGGAKVLCLLAEHDGAIVGCKLGYSLDNEVFYSWLGGVSREFRQSRVASRLMDHQEKWAKEFGYKQLRVKSMNHYPNMMRFLISRGYQIVDIEPDVPQKLKVHFQKEC